MLTRGARAGDIPEREYIMRKRNVTPADIGDIVRATRKDTGLRQHELAGAAGVGLRFIVDLEAGKPTAQIGKVLQVLAALGCSVDIVPPLEIDATGPANVRDT